MQDLGITSFYRREYLQERTGSIVITIFDGGKDPGILRLPATGRTCFTFGRDEKNDVVLESPLVSRMHGRFICRGGVWYIEDRGVYTESPSLNGLIFDNEAIYARELMDGDIIRIDNGLEAIPKGVLFVVSEETDEKRWKSVSIQKGREIRVGRDPKCEILLPHTSVSRIHARIFQEGNSFYIIDQGSTNGTLINNRRIFGRTLLHEKDVIVITNSKLIFTSSRIFYCSSTGGISVDVGDVVITRDGGKKITCNHVSLSVRPGELVAVIGGSGAGKSTVLNCMCGYLRPDSGKVCINGVDLYRNADALKNIIGYVPQSDIVFDNLKVRDMLRYTAKLRLPKDATEQDQEKAIERALRMVELWEFRDMMIGRLSGGQRKRASIAVELLSDPNLLFLDEPASGLDPGIERSLMLSLRKMADGGKTIILVTHSTLQLSLCDRIVFMGKGGNLCFYGSEQEALQFFQVPSVVDIYNMITEKPEFWKSQYLRKAVPVVVREQPIVRSSGKKKERIRQLPVLCARYLKLVLNDRKRLLLLLLQAPVLAMLISLVADGNQFDQYEMTKSLLFALSCSAFWVGMLNSIQEICKERTILRREYMTGLSLTSYLISKIVVLSLLCVVQSILIIAAFGSTVGMPEEGLLLPPSAELFITTFLTSAASAAMGLFISALFYNPDRAMTVAPILLMPQILFSGLIFQLEGITETASWLAVCRWSMEGYGTTANLNDLPKKLELQGVPIERNAEDFYEFTSSHLMGAWGYLIFFMILFLVLGRVALQSVKHEKS